MHGCEYMTAGVVVVLGRTGRNFGAGMSGGVAYLLDDAGDLETRLNPALVGHDAVVDPDEIERLRSLIAQHLERTGSEYARELIEAWPESVERFRRVAPRGVGAVSAAAVRTRPRLGSARSDARMPGGR